MNNFNLDPKWREQYAEQKKYEVWHLFFQIKVAIATFIAYFVGIWIVGTFF